MRAPAAWMVVTGLVGAAAVGLGAYGHHALPIGSPEQDAFATGVRYHMWHALAMLAVTLFADGRDDPRAVWASRANWFFVTGIVLFSGSLYWFGLSGEIAVEGAAPLGGFNFMAGWAMLAVAATRSPRGHHT